MSQRFKELHSEADELERQARELRRLASVERQRELKATPLGTRLIYAATARCLCGAGMAYDPASPGDDVFKGPSKWECSAILLYGESDPQRQAEVKAATHTGALPFAFYEIKSEDQPSQNGRTTRPVEAARA